MDRLIQDGEKLGPKDRAERVALFRVQVIGPLLARDFQDHGELADEIRALAAKWHRPPESSLGRKYSAPTIERWYYEYKRGGLDALRPRRRSDMGHARELTEEQRALLLDIRREYPRATAALILRTLVLDGRLEKGAVSPSTLRRLYQEHGLDRVKADSADGRVRLRWQADRADALWHSDVCHGPAMKLGERTVPLRIHALLDDHSRYIVAIQAATTEREVEMLALTVKAMRDTGRRPGALYLDNGSTYRGDVLQTLCARLGVGLLHAEAEDPQARGKMERFWRTLRQGCLDHIGTPGSLQDVQVRLLAFLGKHYHVSPHASLMGKTPAQVYETAPRDAKLVTEAELGIALNNAGISIYGRLDEVSLEDARRLFDVNFWGVVHGSHADALRRGGIARRKPGLVEQELGWRLVPIALEAPAALSEQPVDALGGAARDVEHLGVAGRAELFEHEHSALRITHVDAVEAEQKAPPPRLSHAAHRRRARAPRFAGGR